MENVRNLIFLDIWSPRRERPALRAGHLLAISLGSIIGTGWLFAIPPAASTAGPEALILWLVAASVVLILALINVELGGMFMVSGGNGWFSIPAFGGLIGFTSGWFYLLNAAATAPVEVKAILTYVAPWLTTTTQSQTVLTTPGYLVAAVGLFVLFVVNVITGIGLLARLNWWTVWLRVFLIGVVAFFGLVGGTPAQSGFFDKSPTVMFTAAATSQIMFALVGFEQAVQFGAETSPTARRHLGRAVVWSIVLAVLVYLAIQLAYTTLTPGRPISDLDGKRLTTLVVIAAVISPAGVGLLYMGGAARQVLAMARSHRLQALTSMNEARMPLLAVGLAYVIALVLLLPVPSWQAQLSVITNAAVLTYAIQAVTVTALRRQLPTEPRVYRLPIARILGPAGFILANEIILLGGWDANRAIGIALAFGVGIVLPLMHFRLAAERRPPLHLRHALWLVPYLGGLGAISSLSGHFGGVGWLPQFSGDNLPFPSDVLAVAGLSVVIYWIASRQRLPAAKAAGYLTQLRESGSVPGPAAGPDTTGPRPAVVRSLVNQLVRRRTHGDESGRIITRRRRSTVDVLLIEHPAGGMQLPGAMVRSEIARAMEVSARHLQRHLETRPLPSSWWVLDDPHTHCFRCVWLPLTEAAQHVEGLPVVPAASGPDTTALAPESTDLDPAPDSHYLAWHGRWLLQRWLAPAVTDPVPRHVQALAVTSDGEAVVVSIRTDDSGWGLPGGNVEPGETATQALERLLAEVAGARLVGAAEYLGSQEETEPLTGAPRIHLAKFRARVELGPFRPGAGNRRRRLWPYHDVQFQLVAGRQPAAAAFLAAALRAEDASRSAG